VYSLITRQWSLIPNTSQPRGTFGADVNDKNMLYFFGGHHIPHGKLRSIPVCILVTNNLVGATNDLWYLKCLPGEYNDAGVCRLCPSGSWSANHNSTSCNLCPPNTFLSISGATEDLCAPCTSPLTSSEGSHSCSCRPGTELQLDACVPCTYGTYKEVFANSSCSACPPGTYSNAVGANSSNVCVSCELGASSPPGARNCACDVGFTNSSDSSCTKSGAIRSRILVPLYIYPLEEQFQPGGQWHELIKLAATHAGNIEIAVIVNQNNGDFTTKDLNYEVAIGRLRDAGIKILAYISSAWGNRSMDLIEMNMVAWQDSYNIHDVFIDEASRESSLVSHYQTIYNRWKTIMPNGTYFILNQGTDASEDYYKIGPDVSVIIFENAWALWPPNLRYNEMYHSQQGILAHSLPGKEEAVEVIEACISERLQWCWAALGSYEWNIPHPPPYIEHFVNTFANRLNFYF
jgi:hypothetical protein